MSKIPKELLKEILADPFYRRCCLFDSDCSGRITFEHSLIYAGKQLQEKFAIIPLCEFHHSIGKHLDGGNMVKEKNEWVALSRATPEELQKYSKAIDLMRKLKYLQGKYGTYKHQTAFIK
jgi:hypothetical protein